MNCMPILNSITLIQSSFPSTHNNCKVLVEINKIITIRRQEQQHEDHIAKAKRYILSLDQKQTKINEQHAAIQPNDFYRFPFFFFSIFIKEQPFFYNRMKQSMQEWIAYGKHYNRMLFFYEDKVLDLTEFALYHPGGKKAIANYIYKDITDILFNVFPHKREDTLDRLYNYIKGTIPNNQVAKRSKVEKSPAKEKKKVCFQRNSDQNSCNSHNNSVDKTAPVDKKAKVQVKQKAKQKKQKDEDKSKNKSPQTVVKTENSPAKSKKKKHVKKKTLNGEQSVLEKTAESEFNKDIQFNSELDEEKPDFKVPIQRFHHMGQLQT